MATPIPGTVPFLGVHAGHQALRLGDVLFVPRQQSLAKLPELLERHLLVGRCGSVIAADEAEELVAQQYESCLEHVFSSETWRSFRNGQGDAAAIAYLIETRHYLHAATSRMSGGVASMPHEKGINGHLAEHLIEEADHARFFEDALELLDIPRSVVASVRPHPTTLQWILVMRAAGLEDPLAAAITSGLMESSAVDRDLVRGWHEMMVEAGLLPREVVAAMRRHVDLDEELGHGANWRDCLRSYVRVDSHRLANALNWATIAAEAVRLWSDALSQTPIARVVSAIATTDRARNNRHQDAMFEADRVWSAPFQSALVTAPADTGYSAAVTAAYSTPLAVAAFGDEPLGRQAHALRLKCGVPVEARPDSALEATLRSWLCAIDGHELWADLTERDDATLVAGWIIENYHYLATSARHVSAAVFACPDAKIRQLLTRHLAEEVGHESILAEALLRHNLPTPAGLRPLPSTAAFVGYLRELALLDWKAYVVALGFLQLSLTPGDSRHSRFYSEIASRSAQLGSLAGAMQQHDRLDTDLNHEQQVGTALQLLQSRHAVPPETQRRAAIVPQLVWGFLEGIRQHYSGRPHAIVQRLAWHCRA